MQRQSTPSSNSRTGGLWMAEVEKGRSLFSISSASPVVVVTGTKTSDTRQWRTCDATRQKPRGRGQSATQRPCPAKCSRLWPRWSCDSRYITATLLKHITGKCPQPNAMCHLTLDRVCMCGCKCAWTRVGLDTRLRGSPRALQPYATRITQFSICRHAVIHPPPPHTLTVGTLRPTLRRCLITNC